MEDIRIYDSSLRLTGICDVAGALWHEEKFAHPGAFSLIVPLSWANRFARGAFVALPLAEDGFFVQGVREDSAAGVARITGASPLALYGRRILTEEVTESGAAETVLCALAVKHAAGALPCEVFAERSGYTETVEIASGHETVLSAMESICAASGLGMRLSMDLENRRLIFAARHAVERGIFLSRSLGNLTGVVRVLDDSRYKNRVIVAGNGGHTVVVEASKLFSDGFDDAAEPIHELWSDASELAMSRYATEEAYQSALAARGKRILAARRPVRSLTIETDEATAAALTLGDICTVSDETMGLSARALCTAKSCELRENRLRYAATLTVM